jgi:hypothetical protein
MGYTQFSGSPRRCGVSRTELFAASRFAFYNRICQALLYQMRRLRLSRPVSPADVSAGRIMSRCVFSSAR